MTGFRDQGARRQVRRYVERSNKAKASQGAPLRRRSNGRA